MQNLEKKIDMYPERKKNDIKEVHKNFKTFQFRHC